MLSAVTLIFLLIALVATEPSVPEADDGNDMAS